MAYGVTESLLCDAIQVLSGVRIRYANIASYAKIARYSSNFLHAPCECAKGECKGIWIWL
jgi:hypothetical protein